jgi:hypothetical protein
LHISDDYIRDDCIRDDCISDDCISDDHISAFDSRCVPLRVVKFLSNDAVVTGTARVGQSTHPIQPTFCVQISPRNIVHMAGRHCNSIQPARDWVVIARRRRSKRGRGSAEAGAAEPAEAATAGRPGRRHRAG